MGQTASSQEDIDTNHTQAQKRETPPPSDGKHVASIPADTRGRHHPSGAASDATPKQLRQSKFHTPASKDKIPMTHRPICSSPHLAQSWTFVVINYTPHTFTQTELEDLGLGLNFCPNET